MARPVAILGAAIALAACGGSSSSAAPSRCGRTSLTSVTWVGSAGWVGVGVPAVAFGYYDYYDGWYDPGDTYDPATAPTDSSGDAPSAADGTVNDGPTVDDSSGESSMGDTSTESAPPLTAVAAPGPNGCWTCTVGCTATGANGQPTGRQAIGVSDVSYDDACRSAVRSVEGWSHRVLRARVGSCQRFDPTTTRVPAAPSVVPR